MSVRSAVLAAAHILDGAQHTICACPAGSTLIVKEVRLFNSTAAAVNIQVYVFRAGGAAAWLSAGSVQPSVPLTVACWTVMEPTDIIACLGTTFPYYVWISGTVLEGVAPPTEQNLSMSTLPGPQ